MADDETKETKTSKAEEPARHPLEVATEQGYVGEKVDPEPNERYTVAGVVKAAEEAAKK